MKTQEKDIKTQVEATLVNVAHNGKYTDSGQEVMDAGVIESATTQILSLINEARVSELEKLQPIILFPRTNPSAVTYLADRIKELRGEK